MAIPSLTSRWVRGSSVPAHRVELLHRNILKFGTITNTLAAAVELTGEVVTRLPSELSKLPHQDELSQGGADSPEASSPIIAS
jgi:hypothetical protein